MAAVLYTTVKRVLHHTANRDRKVKSATPIRDLEIITRGKSRREVVMVLKNDEKCKETVRQFWLLDDESRRAQWPKTAEDLAAITGISDIKKPEALRAAKQLFAAS